MTQLSLAAVNNKNLFSNHFLENLLKSMPEWSEKDHIEPFQHMLDLYEKEKAWLLPSMKEAELEERFFRPILKLLGFTIKPQPTLEESKDFPDYALFKDRDDLDKANRVGLALYDNALAICEVKRWEIELDRFGRGHRDKSRNPSFQIWLYLKETKPRWGILTNGRRWRLHHKEMPLDTFYEVDVVDLLETGDIEGFRYFYYFFRKDAFLERLGRVPFLDQVMKGSRDYAQSIGKNLKENVYRAITILAQGFFDRKDNALDPSREENLQLVQHNSMRLLYRMLFILYAEDKGLLSEPSYISSQYSFNRLKREIADRKDKNQTVLETGTSYWARLKDLFGLINRGSEGSGIPRNQFFVPPYNGGLFDVDKNKFLEEKIVGDRTLVDVIDMLARARDDRGSLVFVDYSTLEIRHLGSIYEGLLEYRIRYADKRMVAVGDKLQWMCYDGYHAKVQGSKTFEDFSEDNRAETCTVYLETDKGEKKSTGSYYTPEYIVKYIVDRTVGRVVERKWTEAADNGRLLKNATLSIKILDPAMGSGHFLVGAIEYLSAKLIEAVKKDVEEGRITEEEAINYTLDWAKREVVSRCIYGVDLNELAVELAKVGLWLTTISKEKPLSFLDHRLKNGNSLMGARLVDLKDFPDLKSEKMRGTRSMPSFISQIFIDRLIGKIKELESVGDNRIEDIKKKEQIFGEFKHLSEYEKTKAIADVYTSLFFSNVIPPTERRGPKDTYYDLIYSLDYPRNWDPLTRTRWFEEAIRIAQEKRFFHWELEFPEVFLENTGGEENGFDAVIGNPPYVRIYRGQIAEEDIRYFSLNFASAHMKFDLYVLFMELGIKLLKRDGLFSMIVPDKWMNSPYGKPIRRKILGLSLEEIADLRGMKVFEEATVDNVVPVVMNRSAEVKNRFSVVRLNPTESNGISIGHLRDLSSSDMLLMPDSQLRLEINDEKAVLISKIRDSSIPLRKVCYLNWGLRTGTAEKTRDMISQTPQGPRWRLLIRGEDIKDRYRMEIPDRYIDYDPSRLYNPMFPEFFEGEKLVWRKISGNRGLMGVLDESGAYAFSTLIVAVNHFQLSGVKRVGVSDPTPESMQYKDLGYILALANSKLMKWYYEMMLSDQLCVVPNHINELPIPRISFQDPHISKHLENLKSLYVSYLGAGDLAKLSEFLWSEDYENVRKSVIVHDFLSFVSREMMRWNNASLKLIKDFASWFLSPAGLGIESLQLEDIQKVKEIVETRTGDAEAVRKEFASYLKKKKVSLSPSQLAKLNGELMNVLSELAEINRRLSRSDALIDLLVYRLLDLNLREISIIENMEEDAVREKYHLIKRAN